MEAAAQYTLFSAGRQRGAKWREQDVRMLHRMRKSLARVESSPLLGEPGRGQPKQRKRLQERLPVIPMVKSSPSLAASASTAASSSTGRRQKAKQRNEQRNTGDDVASQAVILSRRHRADYHEVKWILNSLKMFPPTLANGGLDVRSFEQFLKRAFDVKHVQDELLNSAYKDCGASSGPIDLDGFFTWYHTHMFSLVAPLTASREQQESDSMIRELGKRYELSPVDVDKIKAKFDSFDLDKSGEIEYCEFAGMMQLLLNVEHAGDIPPDRMTRFWKEIDTDNSGGVDFPEFLEWYVKYFAGGKSDPVEAFYHSYMPETQWKAANEAEARAAKQKMMVDLE
mmetsp:Transcript_65299/g.115892  ORF Transcript_65299/g.115892 Transcript_65299/m.115892 type:complete len:340 (+) Transcript_65299:75-1094(+)